MELAEIVSLRYPMLTKSGYLAWSSKIKEFGMLLCVEPEDPKVPIEEKKD